MDQPSEACYIRIKKAMELRHMKQVDLVNITKLGKSAISQYISGKFEPKQKALHSIAKALDVSEAWLMGYDVPLERIETIKTIISTEEKKFLDMIEILDDTDKINLENYIKNVLLVSDKYSFPKKNIT